MAASTYTTNLTDLYAGAGSTTNWSALGGGQSGLSAETDYFIQGTGMTSKGAFASAKKGMIFDSGSDRAATIGTDGAVLIWTTHATPNSLAAIAAGGIDLIVGSASSAYKHWYVGGSDTIEFMGWIIAAVNPSETTDEADTGSPTAVEQFFGILFDLPTGGPTKGAPNAIDAIRVGRCDIIYELGTAADPDASFTLAVTNTGDVTNRLGLIQERSGSFFVSGLHQLGSATNVVNFTDSNKTLFWNDHPAVTAPFNTVDIQNASSTVAMTNLIWTALGTKSPGTFTVTDDATVDITTSTFTDWGAFSFLSNTTVLGTTFRRCALITLGNGTFTNCIFDSLTGTTGALAATPAEAAKVTNSEFISDGTGNGLEITGTAANITLSGIDFTGYSATVDADKAIFVNIATGSMTINISGGSGVTASSHVRTAGAVVTVSADVTVTFTGLKDNTEVRVYKTSDDSVIDGIENATAGTTNDRSFSWAAPAATDVYYVIHQWSGAAPFYQTIRKEGYIVPSADTSVGINQLVNRNAS